MADRKITDLTALAAGSQATGDLLTIVDVSEAAAADKNKKITVESLFKGIPGDVGVGVSSPGASLDVQSASDQTVLRLRNNGGNNTRLLFANKAAGLGEIFYQGDFRFVDDENADAERLRIDSSGNVGIKSTNPLAQLHILNTSGTTGFYLSRANGTALGDQISIRMTTDAAKSRIYGYGDALTFWTAATGGTASERLRIDSSGNVGINTTSPFALLHVKAATNRNLIVQNGGTDTIEVSNYNSGDGYREIAVGGSVVKFQTGTAGGGSSSERMRIDSSGNIGIGATPSAWGGSRNAIQFDSAGAAYICNDSTVGIVSNMYFDGSNNKYINAGTASTAYFQQDNVLFQFAPSGSANANGTFTTSTRIDADGVKFGSDTAAANALDDYEVGTFTPTLAQGVTSPGYTNVGGTYTKIGDCVTFTLRMRVSSGTNNSAQVLIGGLPFSSSSSAREGGAFFNYRHDLNSSSAGPFMHISQGSTQITFYNNIGGSWNGNNGAGLINRTLHIQGHYFV